MRMPEIRLVCSPRMVTWACLLAIFLTLLRAFEIYSLQTKSRFETVRIIVTFMRQTGTAPRSMTDLRLWLIKSGGNPIQADSLEKNFRLSRSGKKLTISQRTEFVTTTDDISIKVDAIDPK